MSSVTRLCHSQRVSRGLGEQGEGSARLGDPWNRREHTPPREEEQGLTSTGAAGSLNPQTVDTCSPVSSRRAGSRETTRLDSRRQLDLFNFVSFSFGPADARL